MKKKSSSKIFWGMMGTGILALALVLGVSGSGARGMTFFSSIVPSPTVPEPPATLTQTPELTFTPTPKPTWWPPESTETPTLIKPTRTPTPIEPTRTPAPPEEGFHNEVLVSGTDQWGQEVEASDGLNVVIYYPEVGLSVRKTLLTERPVAGGEVVFEIEIANEGETKLDVALTDLYRTDVLEYVGDDIGLAHPGPGELNWSGQVEAGESVHFVVRFLALKPTVS